MYFAMSESYFTFGFKLKNMKDKKHFYEVYKDFPEEFRWRLKTIDGEEVVAVSADGYVTFRDVLLSISSQNYGGLELRMLL